MSTEQSLLVAVPRDGFVAELVGDAVSAARRAEKADPGDRTDVIRYEALCVRLEALAERSLAGGARFTEIDPELPVGAGYCFDDVIVRGDPNRLGARLPMTHAQQLADWGDQVTVVALRRALQIGDTTVPAETREVPEPAEPWRADGDVAGSRAVEQRFRSQFDAVLEAAAASRRTRGDAVNPSGVNNRIITQTLHEYVRGTPATRVDVAIAYRDGSRASHPFPLRCLPMSTDLPTTADLNLHLALLSIRHTEMDPVVDGAWLRNAEVSRPRPAALTDDFVFETSRAQLRELTRCGQKHLLLHIYQTGLDTAVVGFYRAVVVHLLEHPFTLSVVPMFFSSACQGAGVVTQAPFRPGSPWTMGEER